MLECFEFEKEELWCREVIGAISIRMEKRELVDIQLEFSKNQFICVAN